VTHPEFVARVQITRPRFDFGSATRRAARILLNDNSVQGKVQHIVGKRLIGPGVVQRSGHVNVAVQNNQQRTLKTAKAKANDFVFWLVRNMNGKITCNGRLGLPP
jgi:hypothetical protein